MAGQSQRTDEWQRHFPVGALLAMGAPTTLPLVGSTECNNVTGLTEHLLNHAGGLLENNLRYLLMYNSGTYFHEQQQALLAAVETYQRRGNAWAFGQFMGKVTVDAATGPAAAFVDNGAAANTRAVADPIVQAVVNDVSDHPALLGYALSDDVHSVSDATKAAKNVTLTQSFQALDPAGRVAAGMWRNTGYSALGADCKYILTYEYPCGNTAAGAATPEGDFHRATFPAITGTSDPDWVDVIRHRTALLPAGARHMWCLQVHHTNTGAAASRLRAPTDRELRAQFWIAVGEGATGLFWFTFSDYDIGGGGGVQPMLGARASALAIARELSDRLTPTIRGRLLGCTADGAATPFTSSGGGTSGLPVNYASAYIGSLTHSDGTQYVVVCNRDTSTANVTISSVTLTGYLVSLETGTRYKLGTDAISLTALNGTILRYDPQRGVPVKDVDLSVGVEAWWLTHWANPASVTYWPPTSTKFYANTVTVPVGGNLQALVDAAPDNTTFVLAAGGTYSRVTLVERNGLHFKSADAGNKAICRGFDIYGSTHAQQYNSSGSSFGFVSKLFSGTDASLTSGSPSIRATAQKRFLRTPSRDFVFKDIDFTSDGSLVYYRQFTIAGTWQTDHWYANAAVAMRCVKDVLIEGCAFSGYKWGTDNAVAGPNNDPQENITGPTGHPGVVWGNAGIRNVVVRGCTFTLATNADNRGFPYAVFFDGAQGVVCYGNTISGKQHAGTFLFLTNDDYTGDFRNPGVVDRLDQRQARQCVIASNAVTPSGSATLIFYAGEQLLCKANTVNVGAGTIAVFVNLDTKVCRLAASQGVFYLAFDSVLDGNSVTGTVTKFIEWNTLGGYTPGLTSTHPARSRVGRATIKNNTVSGTVASWHALSSGSSVAADTPITESGNTP